MNKSNSSDLPNDKKLSLVYPDLAKEFDIKKNRLTPNLVHIGSNKKYWWICKNGHSYQAVVSKRTREHHGCPYCSGHKICVDNCVSTLRPDLNKWWDNNKNDNRSLKEFGLNSNYVAWWKCEKGHSFQQKIAYRIRGKECPVCNGQLITKDNCLATLRPDLCKEWDVNKNFNLSPYNLGPGSHKKVWWKCVRCGYEWKTPIYSRGSMNTGCPQCDSEKRTSFPEQAIGFYLSTITDVIYRAKINKVEIDIYLPKLSLGIEYDGAYFHSREGSKEREAKKNKFLRSKSICLIRVKELKEKHKDPYLNFTEYGCAIFISYNQNYLFVNSLIDLIVSFINKQCGTNYEIKANIKEDQSLILERYMKNVKENSLAFKKPVGVKKWDYCKNGNIDPSTIPASSKKRFWWKCPTCGYEWYGSVENLTNTLTCKNCVHSHQSKAKIIINKYDLFDANSELMEEWDYSRNVGINPKNISPGSNLKVWWICKKCGHSWQAVIKTRNKGVGCPRCANKKRNEFKYKKIINVDTNEVFNSIQEAAKHYSIGRTNITSCLRKRGKTAGGYHWEYFRMNK